MENMQETSVGLDFRRQTEAIHSVWVEEHYDLGTMEDEKNGGKESSWVVIILALVCHNMSPNQDGLSFLKIELRYTWITV
jgi:hypothetical protein